MKTLYSLPAQVKYCKYCVVSNQKAVSSNQYRDTINSKKITVDFDDSGVCAACNFQKRKEKINWLDREAELHELLGKHRSKDGSYDVVVPGSGGKDSCYAAHILKYKYGMNPLTVTWRPHIYTKWGQANFYSWLSAGFANISVSSNPHTHRLLSRLSLENLFHPFQTFGLGQFSVPSKIALKFGIKLVMYGEDGAEYRNSAATTFDPGEISDKSRPTALGDDPEEVFLAGLPILELKEIYGISQSDIDFYLPPKTDEIREKELLIAKLGYYLPWRPQQCFYYASEKCGFKPAPERTQGTYTKFNSIDDKMDDLFYWTGFIKFCQGRATLDASQDIYSGEITRHEAISLVNKYDGEYPDRFEEEVFEYLSLSDVPQYSSFGDELPDMTRDRLMRLADKFRSPHLWNRGSSGEWIQLHKITQDDGDNNLEWIGKKADFAA